MTRGVLDGAFALLEALDGRELRPSELAKYCGLPKTTTHRMLDQLVALGAVERAGEHYRIGHTLFRLGATWTPAGRLSAAARAAARGLAATRSDCTVGLVAFSDSRTIVVNTLHGERFPGGFPSPGTIVPAGMEPDLVRAAFAPDTDPPDGYTTTEWRRLVWAVRARDGVVTTGQYFGDLGLSVAGAPVRDRSGTAIGAIGIVVHGHTPVHKLEPLVLRAARLTSGTLARSVSR
ncbi:DNA-binding IclR family transcriptional regulator [Herbihabitans rhizosphaerae]|uniref:DNA-binding IclR family transcriptional regulator n=1 Tax=Herbihabitans rhizosphaerae TaxID=1872711 RepID=A0A4Q7L745_9PSEU|nr:helix-turn-helix domain-containing protein [Herbihabitans rhizosphaerae]RZS44441.1 DNA-binding IclR family transcriptional regulator [Herbihabitans rhizosphaerae]